MAENLITNKSLSIRVCSNGLSFCTYAPGQEEPFEYKVWDMNHTISLTANLKDALMKEPMLQQEYQRVNVMIATPHFTTVPVAAFQKENVEALYRCAFPKDAPQHVSYNVLRRSGIAIVFGLDRNVYQLLLDDFPRARFYASASTLIEFFGEITGKGVGQQNDTVKFRKIRQFKDIIFTLIVFRIGKDAAESDKMRHIHLMLCGIPVNTAQNRLLIFFIYAGNNHGNCQITNVIGHRFTSLHRIIVHICQEMHKSNQLISIQFYFTTPHWFCQDSSEHRIIFRHYYRSILYFLLFMHNSKEFADLSHLCVKDVIK